MKGEARRLDILDSCDLFIRVKLFQFYSVIRLDKDDNDKVVTCWGVPSPQFCIWKCDCQARATVELVCNEE